MDEADSNANPGPARANAACANPALAKLTNTQTTLRYNDTTVQVAPTTLPLGLRPCLLMKAPPPRCPTLYAHSRSACVSVSSPRSGPLTRPHLPPGRVSQKLADKLGQGGMGAVYKALDWNTGETVAIKQVSTWAGFELRLRRA